MVQAVNGQNVVTGLKLIDVGNEGPTLDTCVFPVTTVGIGVPHQRGGHKIAAGNFIAIYVSNKGIVTPHIQCHLVVFLLRVAADGERNTDVTGGIYVQHDTLDVDVKVVFVIAAAIFVSDSAGAGNPTGQVTKTECVPAADWP